MKKFILLALVIIGFSNIVLSQNHQKQMAPDIRLSEVFDQEYLNLLKEKNPDLIIYYNCFLDQSYFIIELDAEKMNSQKMSVISLKGGDSAENLNILKYNLKRDFEKYMHYRIGSSNKAIVMIPENEFMKKYSVYKNRIKSF